MEFYRRPTPLEQLLRQKMTTDGIHTRRSTSNTERRLHDLKDGFYALGTVPKQRNFLIVNVRGQRYRFVGLPMGWSLSPYHSCAFTDTFVRHLRQPDPGGFTTHHGQPTISEGNRPSKRFLQHTRGRGAKILPYFDEFLFFAAIRELELALRQRVDRLLTSVGLLRHPTKGF
jgi:hypothetical protein